MLTVSAFCVCVCIPHTLEGNSTAWGQHFWKLLLQGTSCFIHSGKRKARVRAWVKITNWNIYPDDFSQVFRGCPLHTGVSKGEELVIESATKTPKHCSKNRHKDTGSTGVMWSESFVLVTILAAMFLEVQGWCDQRVLSLWRFLLQCFGVFVADSVGLQEFPTGCCCSSQSLTWPQQAQLTLQQFQSTLGTIFQEWEKKHKGFLTRNAILLHPLVSVIQPPFIQFT